MTGPATQSIIDAEKHPWRSTYEEREGRRLNFNEVGGAVHSTTKYLESEAQTFRDTAREKMAAAQEALDELERLASAARSGRITDEQLERWVALDYSARQLAHSVLVTHGQSDRLTEALENPLAHLDRLLERWPVLRRSFGGF